MSDTCLLHEEWFFTSSRLIGSGLIFTITSVLDLIIVAIVVTNKEDVGHYAAVLTICGCIWLPAMNLYQLVGSKASGLLSSQEGKVKLQSMLDRTNKVVIFLTAILSIAIIGFSSELLAHFGPTYANARYVLIIMTLGAFVAGSFRFASLLLIYGGFERLSLMVNAWQLVILILLAVPATYFFGITGAAVATATVLIARAFAAVYFVRKKVGMRSTLWF
jgi:O-antigen/teichoic acid export membrane protein